MLFERKNVRAARMIERCRFEPVLDLTRDDRALVWRQILPRRARAVQDQDRAFGKSGKRERADRVRPMMGDPFDPDAGLPRSQDSIVAQVIGRRLASSL